MIFFMPSLKYSFIFCLFVFVQQNHTSSLENHCGSYDKSLTDAKLFMLLLYVYNQHSLNNHVFQYILFTLLYAVTPLISIH